MTLSLWEEEKGIYFFLGLGITLWTRERVSESEEGSAESTREARQPEPSPS